MPIDIRQKIRQVGVLGAGTMGNGIAQAFAVAGYSVIMREHHPRASSASSMRSAAGRPFSPPTPHPFG
jgi:3-hydroxybutyryl-CoA dehydrogenase